jgi:hypothetical protein
MDNLLFIGQWQGFYRYGSDYGEYVEGKETEFRLFIEKIENNRFSGRIIDWDGFNADGDVAEVQGFMSGLDMRFVKKYPNFRLVDEFGNLETIKDMEGMDVVYEGKYNSARGIFEGIWKVLPDLEQRNYLKIEDIGSGVWRLHRSD